MELNADFSRRAACTREARLDALADGRRRRRMLDRIGEEVARATSIVRYAPQPLLGPSHGGGEEFLVLDGVFQDEHGDYPAGSTSAIRRPPRIRPARSRAARSSSSSGSSIPTIAHTCASIPPRWPSSRPERPGVESCRSSRTPRKCSPGALGAGRRDRFADAGGMELLVLEGGFARTGEASNGSRGSGCRAAQRLGQGWRERCGVWVKSGHLAHGQTAPAAADGAMLPSSTPASRPILPATARHFEVGQ